MQIYAMTLLYSPCSLAERQDVCFLKATGTGITLNSTLMVINELLMEKSLITHIILRLIFSLRVREDCAPDKKCRAACLFALFGAMFRGI